MKRIMRPPDRPLITLSTVDSDRLASIATAGLQSRRPTADAMLVDELRRAEIVASGSIRPDVVTMHSDVEYQDEVTGHVRLITPVYPGDEDMDADRVSVLSRIGAALNGLSEGQSIDWHGPTGDRRRLTVRRVHVQPERMAGLGA
jgi:regulator of nucleoside diphosphate kinase